jgi:hypothetical protein
VTRYLFSYCDSVSLCKIHVLNPKMNFVRVEQNSPFAFSFDYSWISWLCLMAYFKQRLIQQCCEALLFRTILRDVWEQLHAKLHYYNCRNTRYILIVTEVEIKLNKLLWRRMMLFACLSGPVVSFTGQIEHKGDIRRLSNELFTFNLS